MRALIAGFICLTGLLGPVTGAVNNELEQKLATVKESMARNQAALRQYAWTEQTDISLKGEVKKSTVDMCRYGPDGAVQKTPTGPPAPAPEMRGVRKRIAEHKKDELEDYMQKAVALILDYVPPSPAAMQSAFQAGNASLAPTGPGMVQLLFKDYAKPGDSLVFSFSPDTRSLQKISVNTYLDQKDPVTLQIAFVRLPDGTNATAKVTLDAPAKHLQVVKQDSNYQKLAP